MNTLRGTCCCGAPVVEYPEAESGAGMERIRDWEYSMRYDD